jgi:spore coat polysaccharide biosynthesis predicted glycosyltransferase SpsG
VSTDDPELASLVETYGAIVLDRPEHLAGDDSTVDDVVHELLDTLKTTENLLVIQPTVVAQDEDMTKALRKLAHNNWPLPVVAGVKPHSLMWAGGVAPPRSNIQNKPIEEIVEVDGQFIDIDTAEDLAAARHLVGRSRRVIFDVAYGTFVGTGHMYRTLAIAKELQHHDVSFRFPDWAVPDHFPFPTQPTDASFGAPAIIVKDRLDTSEHEMLTLKKAAPVVTLEDKGGGARHADAVVNALYASTGLAHEYAGSRYAILRPEFRNHHFSRDGVLVTFGGADPLHLTERLASILGPLGATYVKPPYGSSDVGIDNPSMGALLNTHAVVVTSAGRTVLEAAACGTPAIVIAQNAREATHSHLGFEHGNIYLGHGGFVTDDTISQAIHTMLTDYSLQDEMTARALRSIDLKGLQRVVRIINEVME